LCPEKLFFGRSLGCTSAGLSAISFSCPNARGKKKDAAAIPNALVFVEIFTDQVKKLGTKNNVDDFCGVEHGNNTETSSAQALLKS